MAKFENNQILLNKISHRFLVTTKLLIGWKIFAAVTLVRGLAMGGQCINCFTYSTQAHILKNISILMLHLSLAQKFKP